LKRVGFGSHRKFEIYDLNIRVYEPEAGITILLFLRRTLVLSIQYSAIKVQSSRSKNKPLRLRSFSFIFTSNTAMKQLLILTIVVASSFGAFSQGNQPKAEPQIKQYWFVLLKKGNNRNQDSVTASKIQQAHMNNIKRLYEAGKLKVAGPFGEAGDWSGIFIFDCETKEEVEKLLQTDEAIASGRLSYEIKSWYTAPIGSFKPGKPHKS
jgi:uncharacterized protein